MTQTCPPIGGLFFFCRPSAVGRLIVAIVVDAVNGVRCRWTLTHVRQKQTKVAPSLANGNPTLKVILSFWVGAPRQHGNPALIRGARALSSVVTMTHSCHVSFAVELRKQTSAAVNFAASKMRAAYRFRAAAITRTQVVGFSVPNAVKANNNQTPETRAFWRLFELSLLCHE